MLTDEEGRWSQKRIDMCRMQDRCFGVSIPNASRMIEPLLAYYECSNDPIAMKLAALYAKQGLKTVFTPEGRFAPMPQSSGHVHSITCSLSGIAAYAARTGDREMLEACVRIMKVGVPEYFSSWGWGDEVFPDHPADEISRGEINQTGDVIRAALILGNAGFPEFYEMAERYLRSMMLPTQHHEPELRSFLRDKEHPADDSEREVLRRSIGGYAMQRPNDRMRPGDWPVTTLDITSGAVHAMSECYRQRVNIRDRACTVNLLFDYDDDSIRIKSGLPLEGRIAFEVKKPLDQLRIRVPDWVQSGNLQVQVNGQPKPVPLAGIYLELGGLQAGDAVVVLFDVPCRREKETVDGIGYTTTWIGNQIMEILPRGEVSPLPF